MSSKNLNRIAIPGHSGKSERAVALRRRLTDEAARSGWRSAALNTLAAHPDLFRYVGDERAGDWRFLLPELPRGRALCVGGALSPVPLTLAATCAHVTVAADELELGFLSIRANEEGAGNIEGIPFRGLASSVGTGAGAFDLVAALRPSPGSAAPVEERMNWANLAARVAEGGNLYVEVDRPSLLIPPSVARRRLKRLGFRRVSCYWPKPTFSTCEMLLPLGDRRLQRYYVSQVFFAMSRVRRLLRRLLAAAVRAGLFELTLPGYMVVAAGHEGRKGSGTRSRGSGR